MESLFYIAAVTALASTVLVVTGKNASHALIYLIVSLLSVAVIFFLLGAPFAAALEVVVYAGASVVLFLFVVMMLNLGKGSVARESEWLRPSMWVLPSLLTVPLFLGLVYVLSGEPLQTGGVMVGPKAVGTPVECAPSAPRSLSAST